MRSANLMIIAAAMALAPWVGAHAQNGLSTAGHGNPIWPQWQGRLALGLMHPAGWPSAEALSGPQLSSLSLLGDYYFFRNTPASLTRGAMGGFRATSGVLLGSASPRLLSGWGGASGLSLSKFGLSRQSLGTDTAAVGAKDDAATPYLGLGYTSISVGGGWGFSADIGLSTLSGRSAVQLGRSGTAPTGANQNLEDMLRDMRLAPLLHLGVSYSF